MSETPEHRLLLQRLDDLERRLARVEAGMAPAPAVAPPPEAGPYAMPAVPTEDELEFEVGRNWFAKVGVAVLTLGTGFSLTLPFDQLPAGLPSIAAALAGAALFFVAGRARALGVIADWLRGSALLLLWIAIVRFYFFGAPPLLSKDSLAGQTVLGTSVAGIVSLAWRRHAPVLVGLTVVLGYATALVVGAGSFLLPMLLALAAAVALMARRDQWPGLVLAGVVLTPLTYFLWAAGVPFFGRPFHFDAGSIAGPVALLAMIVLFGLASLHRNVDEENGLTHASALLNCALGFGVLLLHTVLVFREQLAVLQIAAFAGLLGLATTFWIRVQSRVSTFLYAMTAYLALTVAIIRLTTAPAVFVWLSLESVVVVATAVWFRSRFIVVANFVIFVAIVLAYLVEADRETGISLGFGVVALVSARILHWQQARLELKTGLMRNAYLFAAFAVFPYALYHLTPVRFVGLAWVGLALGYYAAGALLGNQKFRWMAHATLLLTTVYVAIVGTSRFGPVLRAVSLLALGAVMLAVSLIFARRRNPPKPPVTGDGG